jgi:hypothetical protein
MKTSRYQKRSYRCRVDAAGLARMQIVCGQTDLDILTDRPAGRSGLREKIAAARRDIQRYIERDERFLTSLSPIPVEPGAPAIVRKMAAAARAADVGPMAAVAGALAQAVGRELARAGCREVIVENGGDIFLAARRPLTVGIYAGRKKLLGTLKLVVRAAQMPQAICTSSGTVGHSLNFGCADAAVIIAADAALADAVATATANRVRHKADLEKAIAFARSIKGVRGCLIILKNSLAAWGAVELA